MATLCGGRRRGRDVDLTQHLRRRHTEIDDGSVIRRRVLYDLVDALDIDDLVVVGGDGNLRQCRRH
jgi:hypothetical protein